MSERYEGFLVQECREVGLTGIGVKGMRASGCRSVHPQNIIVFIQVLYANRHFCIKYLDENNNILGVDTSELTIGGV